jgi:hypothetical protein
VPVCTLPSARHQCPSAPPPPEILSTECSGGGQEVLANSAPRVQLVSRPNAGSPRASRCVPRTPFTAVGAGGNGRRIRLSSTHTNLNRLSHTKIQLFHCLSSDASLVGTWKGLSYQLPFSSPMHCDFSGSLHALQLY